MRRGHRIAAPLRDRFEPKVSPEPNTGCWLWTGAVNNNGYGVMSHTVTCRERYAHRVAWLIFHGRIPARRLVLHKCNNGSIGCVNPAHLYAGTRRDNADDAKRAGRLSGGPAYWSSETKRRLYGWR